MFPRDAWFVGRRLYDARNNPRAKHIVDEEKNRHTRVEQSGADKCLRAGALRKK